MNTTRTGIVLSSVAILTLVVFLGIVGIGGNDGVTARVSGNSSRQSDDNNLVRTNSGETFYPGTSPLNPFFLTRGTSNAVDPNVTGVTASPKKTPSEGVWLGMEIEGIDMETILELNLPDNQTGVIVDSAPVGSAGERAGLKNGDIITGINRQPIVNMTDYIKATGNQKITSANIEVIRNGSWLCVPVPSNQDRISGAYNTQPSRSNLRTTTTSSPGFHGYPLHSPSSSKVSGQLNRMRAPPITKSSPMPHEYRGVCVKCHILITPHEYYGVCDKCYNIVNDLNANNHQSILPIGTIKRQSSALPSPVQQNAAGKVLVESHWMGMELIPISPILAREYKLPQGANGLLVDEVTLVAAESGLLAGDILQRVDDFPIETIEDFTQATEAVESMMEVDLGVLRNGRPTNIRLRSNWRKLGVAQNEAAQPIKPGAISPHQDRGRPCTDCHIIMRNGGQLQVDAGDILPSPPSITSFAEAPHSYRGACNVCHVIINR